MGFLLNKIRQRFEESKPEEITKADIRMISGCEDDQTSADVSNVATFRLPDPAGRAGGACTSTLLNVLYKDEQTPADTMSFIEVLLKMRDDLKSRGYSQIPQFSASNPIDVNTDFDLVPAAATGTRRAIMIGINYVGQNPGELSGCHNDVGNMKRYIMEVHGFQEENITILMDDGEHAPPTKANIINAYKTIVSQAESGDALFFHYSGHGCKIPDDNGDEDDGFDEALVPVDYRSSGLIRDDDLYDIIVKPMPDGTAVVCLYDCCHSGTILDLPYVFKADGNHTQMEIDEGFKFDKFFKKIGAAARELFDVE